MRRSQLQRKTPLQSKGKGLSGGSPIKPAKPRKQRAPLKPRSGKRKPGRLEGDELRQLNDKVWERDGGLCVICGRPVPKGTKAHHEPEKGNGHGGRDREEDMLTMCMDGPDPCHVQRHQGKRSQEVKAKGERYLLARYPDREETRKRAREEQRHGRK